MSRVPENTSGIGARDLLLEAAVVGTPQAIEAQETRDSAQLVNSDVLPKGDERDRAAMESVGIKLGKDVPGDPLFIYAELPEGWEKRRGEAGDDPRGSYLYDDQGRKRAIIFYKAASYDRYASIAIMRRYRVEQDYDAANDDNLAIYTIADYTGTVHAMDAVTLPTERNRERYEVDSEARDAARKWLSDNYPDCDSPAAYW